MYASFSSCGLGLDFASSSGLDFASASRFRLRVDPSSSPWTSFDHSFFLTKFSKTIFYSNAIRIQWTCPSCWLKSWWYVGSNLLELLLMYHSSTWSVWWKGCLRSQGFCLYNSQPNLYFSSTYAKERSPPPCWLPPWSGWPFAMATTLDHRIPSPWCHPEEAQGSPGSPLNHVVGPNFQQLWILWC